MATQEGQVKTEAPEEGQAEATPSQPKSQEALNADKLLEVTGFKSLDEVAKSLKEGQAKITKLSQEKSQLEQAVQTQYNQPAPQPQGQAGDFFDDPEAHAARVAKNIVQTEMRNFQAQQAIERVRGENPEKFEQLRPIMQQIYTRKPHLNALGEAGIRQAMTEAEQERISYIKSLSDEIESIRAGTPQQGSQAPPTEAEIRQKVLAEMEKNRNAVIPESGVGRAITDDDEKRRNQLVSDGDVDALLDLKLKNIQI